VDDNKKEPETITPAVLFQRAAGTVVGWLALFVFLVAGSRLLRDIGGIPFAGVIILLAAAAGLAYITWLIFITDFSRPRSK
jgi:hypothetical protein